MISRRSSFGNLSYQSFQCRWDQRVSAALCLSAVMWRHLADSDYTPELVLKQERERDCGSLFISSSGMTFRPEAPLICHWFSIRIPHRDHRFQPWSSSFLMYSQLSCLLHTLCRLLLSCIWACNRTWWDPPQWCHPQIWRSRQLDMSSLWKTAQKHLCVASVWQIWCQPHTVPPVCQELCHPQAEWKGSFL